ncbi:MAG: ATP synthase F0 subunit B [Lachnospiraceae bacterium]|nr:ATP synthase F0 subunit B [Lachnospiraceae bacterium]
MTGVPLNIDFQQILLHLLNFAILFFVLYLALYKPVKNFIDKRKAGYQELDDQTKENLDKANALKEEYESKLQEADSEAADIKNKAMDEANAMAKTRTDEAKAEAELILEKARKQAEEEKDRIVAEAGDQIEELAKEAAKKAIFDSTSDAFDSFLDSAEEK